MATTAEPAAAPVEKMRIASVDALRGFDMMWIAGADHVVRALSEASPANGFLALLAAQVRHVQWIGFHFYDLIFPLFVFIAGISIVLSLPRMIARAGKRSAYARIVRRGLLLFALGVLYNGGLKKPWPDVRILGVLPRIAICYVVTSLLFCNLRLRGLIVAFVLCLGGYWAIMTFVPAPGQAHVSFQPDRNIANWIDLHYLPGRLYNHTWDPEGLLSTVPAVGTCLLGVFAGLLLVSEKLRQERKTLLLIAAGAALVALGALWSIQFPVIKKLWTSSYVLVTGGCSLVLLGLFYYIVDVRKWRWWTLPFVWIGANAIACYLFPDFLDTEDLAKRFVGGSVALAVGPYSKALIEAVALLFVFLFARFLYKRHIFLRV